MIRAFLACEIPVSIRQDILKWIKGTGASVNGVRWMGLEQMHLTLRFLGDVTAETLEQVQGCAREITASGVPCKLELKGVGVFSSLRRPRIVWVGLSGELEPLISLQSALEKSFKGLPIHQEKSERPFHPHLTIGRIRDPHKVSGLESLFMNNRERSFGVLTIKSVTLFKSTLTSTGAKYNLIASFPLGGELRRQ